MENKLLGNDKKDKILNYTHRKTFFLKKTGNYNLEGSKYNEEKENLINIKKKFNLKSSSNFISNKKEYKNRYITFRSKTSKKYEINSDMKISD